MTAKKVTMGIFDPAAIAEVNYPFEMAEYTSRLNRIRELMAGEKIDLLYVTMPEAICFIHGYMTSWYKANSPRRYPQMYGTAIHVDHDRFIHFDHPTEEPVLFRTSVSKDNRFFSTREAKPNLEFIINELRREGWLKGTVGLEYWSYIPNRAVSDMMESALRDNGCEVVDGSGVLREVRRVKSPREIKYIEDAVRIADIGHQTIKEMLHPGMTELELYGEVVRAMMAAGGEHQALLPIFTSIPVVDGIAISGGHLHATRKQIKVGEHLTADLCGVMNGYHGNVCRGFFLGDPPTKLVDQYKKAAGVYEVIRNKARAGITLREFNKTLQKYYADAGLWDADGWAIGYELGLSFPPDWVGDFFFDIRDELYLDRDRILEENMVTNFESFFNTTLIDTLVWEKDNVRTLSKMPEGIIAV
jgi:Xaa-Pro aminopeptidase